MKPYKILITGTFESGKTELIKQYSSNPLVASVSEVARDLLVIDPSLQLRTEFQDILFREQLIAEDIAEQSGKPIILCDRGVLDIVAFSLALEIPVKDEWLENSLGRYKSIMICDPSDIEYHVIEDDLSSSIFRSQIDNRIHQVVNDISRVDSSNPEIHQVAGSVLTRKAYLDKYIETTMTLREGGLIRGER